MAEPLPLEAARRRGRLKWPRVRLDADQRDLIISDLARIASLRHFELHAIVAAEDHIHVLLSCDADRDIPRLAQLVKGSLSRTLTVAAGDEPARSTRGEALPYHKWWTRQYSFVALRDRESRERLLEQLTAHNSGHARVWRAEGTKGLRD
jgi:REP element-mobilizing transposase RayT